VTKEHLGLAIRRARRAVEMTQAELAFQIGRSPAFINRFEYGTVEATPAEIERMRSAIEAREAAS
jgi:predicted transcriptional regulator